MNTLCIYADNSDLETSLFNEVYFVVVDFADNC
jgi:hypothetical protein